MKEIEQPYYDLTEYDWYQSKDEVEDVDEIHDDAEFSDDESKRPTQVIMKLIPTKMKKPKTIPKPKTKTDSTDQGHDKITTYFNDLFPISFGERRSESNVSDHFRIDESSQTTNGMVKCKICLETFSTTLKLRYHMVGHKNLTYRCQYCPIEVSNVLDNFHFTLIS